MRLNLPVVHVQSWVAALPPLPRRTSKLAAHGLWNLVSRMYQDKEFIRDCLDLGVVGGLCGAAKGAADLLVALDEVRGVDRGVEKYLIFKTGSERNSYL